MATVSSEARESRIEELRAQAKHVFRPSSPVTTSEFLYGRDEKLRGLLENLGIPGRSAFVYGERGVGKTSLAQTAAYSFNSSSFSPVFVSCHPSMTFTKLVTHIAKRLLDIPVFQKFKTKRVTEASISASLGRILTRVESEDGSLPADIDINDAVELLNQITPEGQATVVVVDEMDTLPSVDVKRDIAFFVKQLGDRECKTKFIFAGIADDVNDLLSGHESASRYVATVKLDRLPLDVLRDIIIKGFSKIDVKIWDSFAMRIAMISDGFAHFTHLVGLKLALNILDSTGAQLEVRAEHLPAAISDSIQDSEAWLKQSYDQAVQKYKDRYEPVLWAAADQWELLRSTEQMFDSYTRICTAMKREPLIRHKFSLALNALKRPTHGEALVSHRASWYKFRQTMLRGYSRMVAASRNVEIGMDYQVRASAPGIPAVHDPEPTPEEVDQFEQEPSHG